MATSPLIYATVYTSRDVCNYLYTYCKEQSEHKKLSLTSQHCKMLPQIEQIYAGNRGKERKEGV